MHHICKGFGVNAHVEHKNCQHCQDPKLPTVQVLEFAYVIIGDFAECHPLDHPKRVGRTENQCCRSQQSNPEVVLNRTHNHHEFANESAGCWQASVGHGKQHKKGDELGHRIDHATVIGNLPAVNTIVEHANTHEHGAGDKTVRDHLYDGSLQTGRIEEEKTQRDKTHVRNRGVSHQLFHVLLHDRHQANVDDRDQGKRDHEPRHTGSSIRSDGQREAKKAIRSQLEHDCRQDNGATGGRLNVGIRQPGMHRPHRHLHCKSCQQREENQNLGRVAQRQGVPGQDVKRSA